jgi:glucan-binding YG repeat protein
LNDFKNLIF